MLTGAIDQSFQIRTCDAKGIAWSQDTEVNVHFSYSQHETWGETLLALTFTQVCCEERGKIKVIFGFREEIFFFSSKGRRGIGKVSWHK